MKQLRAGLLGIGVALLSATCTSPPTPADVVTSDSSGGDAAVIEDAAACAVPAQSALFAAPLDLYVWDGEAAPSVTFAWAIPATCGALHAAAPWATIAGDGTDRTVTANPATLPTGLHTSALELRSATGAVLASATLRLRVLRPPTGTATRHALIVGFDGTRPDALQQANTPVMDFLLR
ncbi:MAG: hypothetical protein WCJ30_20965, partial [Deltaproteobacteria bacterium]